MEIKKVIVGSLQTNCYLLIDDNYCLIVDPGDDYYKLKKALGELTITGIIITHYHFDHIGALNDFIKNDKVKVYDITNLKTNNEIGPFKFEVLQTPGHKEDAITIYFREAKIMLVGDFIFKDDIGRCDLNGGSNTKMKESITLIKKYDNDIKIYPGHGEATTLGYEKKIIIISILREIVYNTNNIFVRER